MDCKIIGNDIQHLAVTLYPGEEFFAEKGALIYLEAGIERDVELNGRGFLGILGAKFSGESVFIIRYFNNCNMPRKLVVGSKMGLLPVSISGESLICRVGSYVGSNKKVDIHTRLSLSGFVGGMGARLQKISGVSTIFLDTIGSPIVVDLRQGDAIEVDEDHIVALHGINESQLVPGWSLKNAFGGEGLSMMRILGPGKVYLSPSSSEIII